MAQSPLDTVTNHLIDKFLETYELESSSIHENFEKFAIYCAIKDNYSHHFEQDDFENILVGGNSDTGIDGLGIIIDNNLIAETEEIDNIISNKDSVDIKIIFIQSTITKTFIASKFRDFTLGVKELFSEYLEIKKTKKRNRKIEEKAKIVVNILEKTALQTERPICILYYCLGNSVESKIGINNDLVEKEKQELLELNLFDCVDVNIIGTKSLHNLYRQTLAKPEVQIDFPNKISFPKIEGVQESYIGIIQFSEFKKLIIDDSGYIRNVFEDNVRYFNEKYEINKQIKNTIVKGDIDKFSLLNNGVTIVTKKIKASGNFLTLKDYQIVNGCQTSNILYQCRNEPNIDKLYLAIKIINTEEIEIANAITTATNSQSPVSFESLNSLLKFHKDLELYYQSASYKVSKKEYFLYYGRQEGKYDREASIPKTRIVSIKEQAKSFVGMFLDAPEESFAYYGQKLQKKIGQNLFIDKHYSEPYYISSVVHYELQKYTKNKNNNFSQFRTYRFHILMILKYMILGNSIPSLDHENIQKSCDHILKIINKKREFENFIQKAIDLITEILETNELDILDAKKSVKFTKMLKSAVCKN